MNKRKKWIVRLFLVFFTLSISVTVIPCGIVNVHGLFGEIKSSVITEDKEQIIEKIASKQLRNVRKVKGTNIFNIWFELLPLLICLCLIEYMLKLPREDTIITLKVRMDN